MCSVAYVDLTGGATPEFDVQVHGRAHGPQLPYRPRPVRVCLHFIPRVIRDAICDLVARNRYHWFGRHNVCILPSADRS